MFKSSFCRCSDEKPLQAIPGDGTHNDHRGLNLTTKFRQLLVSKPRDEMRSFGVDVMFFDEFIEAFFMPPAAVSLFALARERPASNDCTCALSLPSSSFISHSCCSTPLNAMDISLAPSIVRSRPSKAT